jgi:hypothetical protein
MTDVLLNTVIFFIIQIIVFIFLGPGLWWSKEKYKEIRDDYRIPLIRGFWFGETENETTNLNMADYGIERPSEDVLGYLRQLEEFKKTAKTVYIKVTDCSGDYWYKDYVGQVFEVVEKGNGLFDYTWVSGELPNGTSGMAYAYPLFSKIV